MLALECMDMIIQLVETHPLTQPHQCLSMVTSVKVSTIRAVCQVHHSSRSLSLLISKLKILTYIYKLIIVFPIHMC